MLQKIIILITSAFLLSGCADGFKGYFKKSANNKWIDSKGFHGNKRKPLYNKKYINLAKRNVLDENYDDSDDDLDQDDFYEMRSPTRENREMYKSMLKNDAKRRQRQKLEQPAARNLSDYNEDDYPSLNKANDRVARTKYDDNSQLQKELAEIKAMLTDAKSDLTKYKCPIDGDRGGPSARSKSQAQSSVEKSKSSIKKNKADTQDKYSAEEDDFKQIKSTLPRAEDSSYHPI